MLYLFDELVQEEDLSEFRERLKRQPTATYVPIECAGKILEKVHQLRYVFANGGRTFFAWSPSALYFYSQITKTADERANNKYTLKFNNKTVTFLYVAIIHLENTGSSHGFV